MGKYRGRDLEEVSCRMKLGRPRRLGHETRLEISSSVSSKSQKSDGRSSTVRGTLVSGGVELYAREEHAFAGSTVVVVPLTRGCSRSLGLGLTKSLATNPLSHGNRTCRMQDGEMTEP